MTRNYDAGDQNTNRANRVLGAAHGHFAEQLTGDGAIFELSQAFGGGPVDRSQVIGHVYMRTQSGNIYDRQAQRHYH